MRKQQGFDLFDQAATEAFGQKMGRQLSGKGMVIYLQGCLGAGKTTLVRGILQGLGYKGAVKSPTYTLVEPYELADTLIYHFDLYRLNDVEELEYIGVRDYFQSTTLCLVEWPEKAAGLLPQPDIGIQLSIKNLHEKVGRCLTMTAISSQGESMMAAL